MSEYPQELVERVAEAISGCGSTKAAAIAALEAAGVEPPKRPFRFGDLVESKTTKTDLGVIVDDEASGEVGVQWEHGGEEWCEPSFLTLLRAVDGD